MAGIVKMFYFLIRRFFDIQRFFSADNDKHMSLRQNVNKGKRIRPNFLKFRLNFGASDSTVTWTVQSVG